MFGFKFKNKINALIYSKQGINRILGCLGCNLDVIKNCYNPCKKCYKSPRCKKIRKK